jgi:hypothetical protein
MSTTYYITTSLSGLCEAVKFSFVPPPIEVGQLQISPFVLSISAFDDGPHVIDLYAQYSNSQPFQDPQNKWSHLVPQWRFLDTAGNIITQITTEDTPISSGTQFIGITGQAQFYYVDDSATTVGNPVILWATLQVSGLPIFSESDNGYNPVPSYSNSKVIAYTPYHINGLYPASLNITRDGILPLSAGLYWVNQKIPNIISITPDRMCTDQTTNTNILFNIPASNAVGLQMGTVDKTITTIDSSLQEWQSLDSSTSDSYFQQTDGDGMTIGGYVRNTVKPKQITTNATITASIDIINSWYDRSQVSYDNLPYYDTPYTWVSDPDGNLLYRITYPFVDGQVVSAITDWLYSNFTTQNRSVTTIFTTTTAATGFGGIYGIAVDPCYNIWCTDMELERLYKYSSQGELLSTIELIYEPIVVSRNPFAIDKPTTMQFTAPVSEVVGPIAISKDWFVVTSDDSPLPDMYIYKFNYQPLSGWQLHQTLDTGWSLPIYDIDMYDSKYVVVGTLSAMQIYENIDDTWTHVQTISGSSTLFGTSVAVSDKHVITCSRTVMDIFTIINGVWTNTLHTNLSSFTTSYPNTVDIYNNTAIVSQPYRYFKGAIQIYDYDENTQNWTFTQELTASVANNSYFGVCAKIYNNKIIITCQETDLRGTIYIYENINNMWTLSQHIDINSANEGWYRYLEFYNNRFIIGKNTNLGVSNEARIYVKNKTQWSLQNTLSSPFSAGYVNSYMDSFAIHDIHLAINDTFNYNVLLTPKLYMVHTFEIEPLLITPTIISLDGDKNTYVALYETDSIVKYNALGECQYIIPLNDLSSVGTIIHDVNKPILLETDINNNIWTIYTYALTSTLYKYDTLGNVLSTIILPACSIPMDMVFDFNNDIWISITYQQNPPAFCGEVIKIETTGGTQVSSITSDYPNCLTMDQEGNIWYTYGINTIGKINTTTNVNITAEIGTYPTTAWIASMWSTTAIPFGYSSLQGIAADSNNRIWVINSYDHAVYVLSSDTSTINTISLSNIQTDWYINSSTSPWPLQAFGDWTGSKWLQKYHRLMSTTITGNSGPFNIDTIQNYDIRKFNESWDATTQIRDYALPEHLYNDYNLFVNYIGTMIGGLETSANSIARKVYERIANYVPNHSDVDTCNIHQLYALAQEIDVPTDNYDFQFPMDLKRIMDIVSVGQRKLWGGRCTCNLNFKSAYGICENCNHNHASNRGNVLDTSTYVTTANVPFIAEYKFSRNRYELINPLSSNDVFTISERYLLNDPQDYCYYEYIPTFCNVQNEGIISWDDEYTTLDEHVSSLEMWYNPNETVEKMLSYYIHEGLGFSN